MSTLVLRSVKGSPLTSAEIDANVTNLNTDKADKASPTFTGAVTLPNSLLQVTASSYPTIQPTLNLDFANTKLLDPRITFVRNSTAAYYDGQTSAKAEENLFTYSQELDNAGVWAPINATITANSTTAPDGTTTAETITETTATSYHTLYQAPVPGLLANTVYTFSLFVKDIDRRYITLAVAGSNGTYFAATYDLTSVVVTSNNASGTGYSHTSSSITSVGSGWYRLVVSGVVGTAVSGQTLSISLATNGTPTLDGRGRESYLGTSKAVYAWGAQLEQRSSATAYTPTTTAAITNYIPVLMTAPAGVARFDCDPITGKSLGLLIEESRTNLLTYSQVFSSWYLTLNTTLTSSANIAPDGTQSTQLVTATTATGNHNVINSNAGITVTLVPNTASFYAKAGTTSKVGIDFKHSDAGQGRCVFDLVTVTAIVVAGTSASITSVGNGWFRCVLTATPTSTLQSFALFPLNAAGAFSYTGAGESAYFWGAQLEAGSFATSYIPTVASTVTRAADQASMTGTNFSSWYNQSQGSLYAEGDFAAGLSSENFYALMGANYQVFGVTQRRSNLTTRVYDVYTNYNAYLGGQAFTVGANQESFKEAVAISNSYFQSSINGVTATPTYSLITTGNATKLLIGQYFFSLTMTGHIRKLSYYPVALSSNNLVALTS